MDYAARESEFFSTSGPVLDILDSESEDEVVEEGVEEVMEEVVEEVGDPSSIVVKMSSRGCGILFGGRERIGLAAEVEFKYRVKITGIDRDRTARGCTRRVEISRRWGRGWDMTPSDVVGAAIYLMHEIPALAGGDALRYPAISW